MILVGPARGIGHNPVMADCFYTQVDESRFESNPQTAGPWSPDSQHAGPPSALLARAIERFQPREGIRLGRVGVDILSPVPVGPLQIDVTPLRMGRNVELLQAVLKAGGRDVLSARAWRLTTTPSDMSAVGESAPLGPIPEPRPIVMPGAHMHGYLSAIEWAFVSGGFEQPGPARVWMRSKPRLVDDEPMTGWQRALLFADSASGVSMSLDLRRYPAINCDFSVALHRDPVGEWIGLDAATAISPGAGAICTADIHDQSGVVGVSSQTLFVRET